jgi:hypothetical protein
VVQALDRDQELRVVLVDHLAQQMYRCRRVVLVAVVSVVAVQVAVVQVAVVQVVAVQVAVVLVAVEQVCLLLLLYQALH